MKMTLKFLCVLFFAASVAVETALGFRQELTIFTEPDCDGESMRFLYKHPNLTNSGEFLAKGRSYLVTGEWHFYHEFDHIRIHINTDFQEEAKCINKGDLGVKSIRNMGPSETNTVAFAFMSGPGQDGPEIVVTARAANNFRFNTGEGADVWGFSEWTIYANNDFTGDEKCLVGTKTKHWFDERGFKSVIRGCGEKAMAVKREMGIM